jgi:hypothetical protein
VGNGRSLLGWRNGGTEKKKNRGKRATHEVHS